MTFVQDLARRIASSESKAIVNYRIAYLFVILGVLSSVVATISVAAGVLTPVINATLAALPGIIVMILNTFKFESRSKWWWTKNFRLIDLQSELEQEPARESEIKKKMANFLLEHSKEWPCFDFGRPPIGIPIADAQN